MKVKIYSVIQWGVFMKTFSIVHFNIITFDLRKIGQMSINLLLALRRLFFFMYHTWINVINFLFPIYFRTYHLFRFILLYSTYYYYYYWFFLIIFKKTQNLIFYNLFLLMLIKSILFLQWKQD